MEWDLKKKKIKPLTNVDIMIAAKNIKNFRGCFMRDELQFLGKPNENECGIMNLNKSDESGSHWVAWKVINNNKHNKLYFDPFGESPPCVELVKYLGSKGIIYNSERFQSYNDGPICVYLCLKFLKGEINFY